MRPTSLLLFSASLAFGFPISESSGDGALHRTGEVELPEYERLRNGRLAVTGSLAKRAITQTDFQVAYHTLFDTDGNGGVTGVRFNDRALTTLIEGSRWGPRGDRQIQTQCKQALRLWLARLDAVIADPTKTNVQQDYASRFKEQYKYLKGFKNPVKEVLDLGPYRGWNELERVVLN
ncbi:hypothetical protein FRB99_000506 [Tulasnella sp. 403]|nr:hypothetical protein FRB99_000506 [Tulasnella sp. 403]